jgi:hypothetical protein
MNHADHVLNFVAYAAGYASLLTLPIALTFRFVRERILRKA